jgi:ornithine cyclodeaminase/alanine dehydrogenase-like protein (mu-crystallin family)
MREALGLDVAAVDDPRDATKTSDIVVTVTPARTPILSRDMVRGGTFIAAVGADSPDKNEIASDLFAAATIVVDSRAQCAVMGDLHHALAAGAVDLGDVHADLGDLVMGRKPGRSRRDEITLFDSTGIGVLDAVAAVHVNRRARETGIGSTVALGSN